MEVSNTSFFGGHVAPSAVQGAPLTSSGGGMTILHTATKFPPNLATIAHMAHSFDRTTFVENSVIGSSAFGGGLLLQFYGFTENVHCTFAESHFINNSLTLLPGGGAAGGGGALHVSFLLPATNVSVVIDDSVIDGNSIRGIAAGGSRGGEGAGGYVFFNDDATNAEIAVQGSKFSRNSVSANGKTSLNQGGGFALGWAAGVVNGKSRCVSHYRLYSPCTVLTMHCTLYTLQVC
jgi:hypothetical protein